MNDHKGLRPTTMKGASVFGDREPLFPRLHINETEKTGPKAPPRNKMALYEQFTVPSHRFLQPSQAPSATAFQQPHGSGYPYIPYYMPPVHYTNPKNSQAYSQLSQVTPNCGTISGTVMLNEESQKASKRGKVSPCKSSRGLIESRANQVASESPKKGPLKGTESLRRTFLPDNINELSHGSMQLDTVNEKQHAVARSSNQVLLSTSDEVMEGEHERCENPKDTIATDERNSDPISASISQLNTLTKQWHDDVVKLQAGEPPSKDNFSSQPFLTSNGKISNLTAAAFEPKSLDESGTSLVTENNSVLSVEGMAHGCAQAGCESKDQSHQFPLDSSLPKVDRISFDKSEIGCSEGAKLTQEKEPEALVMCGGRYPGSEVDCMPSLKPKDVIQVIGQQQFWKARKTLLRQQRIFSDQVFQLHKLTTVT
ncbi:hypothetical protein KP509_03G010400 [Ceratopteris richardii]|uniref:Uncharacterized protein n=1 Tax=Ceratopteris richardii TaxID=49495 RepID=A0A8T2V8Y1_CERRI|nr:hypothetical protein KP509_03G010400 [Ceratopteris richardii]